MVSIQISRLLNGGFIKDETLPTDRRYHVFQITTQGRRVEEHVNGALEVELPELMKQGNTILK